MTTNQREVSNSSTVTAVPLRSNGKSMRDMFWETVLENERKPELRSSPLSQSSSGTSRSRSSGLVVAPHSLASSSFSATVPRHTSLSMAQAATPSAPHKTLHTTPTSPHVERRDKPFKCEYCDSRYSQKGDMVRHIRCVHEGLRPYKCPICGNSFGRRSILNKHVKIHNK